MNCFYVSVEMMLDPSLRGKAVAVCGSTEDRHGIVLAKSELAKRLGVKTGMVNWEAQRTCPGLIMVRPQYEQYLKYSALVREIYKRYTDLIEPYGMDESWLDVTNSPVLHGDSMEIAKEILKSVQEELGLTVSIGVSFNKIFAKLGSDMKKPNAITQITPDNYKQIVWPLPAYELLYVGRSTAWKLCSAGIYTIGDLAAAAPESLKALLGVNGLYLWAFANGEDQSHVMPQDFLSPVKTIGHGTTCYADLVDDQEVDRIMLYLCQDIAHRLRVHELCAQGVQIGIRDCKLCWKQYQGPLIIPTQSPLEICEKARALFHTNYQWNDPIRSVTVRAIKLVPRSDPQQIFLFDDAERRGKIDRMEAAIEELRRRFGKHSIEPAALIGDIKMPRKPIPELNMHGTIST